MEKERKLNIEDVFMTKSINEKMSKDKRFEKFIFTSLSNYELCDWGDTCEEDRKTNEEALKSGERIIAVYIYPKTQEKILIITERDRSITTIMFLYEY